MQTHSQERQTMSKEFKSTGEHTYKSSDGITYDLTALDDLYDGFASRPRFSAEKDGKQVEIITNNDGEGLWEEIETGTGYDLVQIAGTMQYRLPTTDSGICRQLRKMWINHWAERENPDWI